LLSAPEHTALAVPGTDSIRASPRVADPPAAATNAWRRFATVVAGRPRVRVSQDRGRSYPRSCERELTDRLPAAPAAVLLFDEAASARCLAADFDTKAGQDQVDADAAGFTTLVQSCGGRVFADVSPAGGRHVYVPWAAPVPLSELRPVMQALHELFPSLDIAPMVNAAAGCIRPPGAVHRRGGYQQLTTPLQEAIGVASRPNGGEVWSALVDRLAPQLRAVKGDSHRLEQSPQALEGAYLPRPGGPVPIAAAYERIARTGLYDTARYASPSEARQAVITAAAACGWRLADVAARLETGSWPGLAGFYARYRHHRRSALARDWRKALTHVERGRTARNSPTRVGTHSGGSSGVEPSAEAKSAAAEGSDEYGFVRSWWNGALAIERIRYTNRAGLSVRLVLRALGAMAQRRGTRYLDVGRRSLALACGLDDSTVAAVLRRLRDEPDPVLVLLENHRGIHGDLYELRIPDAVKETSSWRRWRAGRIEAIHPVFRELGPTAALVYEQLSTVPTARREVAHDSALVPRTVDDALTALAAHGLAERVAGKGWRRGERSLDSVAEELNVPEVVEELAVRYRAERTAWQALLGAVPALTPRDVVYGGTHVDEPLWWPNELGDALEDGMDAGESAMELLERELGAVAVDVLASDELDQLHSYPPARGAPVEAS